MTPGVLGVPDVRAPFSWVTLRRRMSTVLIFILILVVIIVVVLAAAHRANYMHVLGGARDSAHIVVDTLNLHHALTQRGQHAPTERGQHALTQRGRHAPTLTHEAIAATIDAAAPVLTQQYAGRVMFVVKDADRITTAAAREVYAAAARRNRVYVSLVEHYEKPPDTEIRTSAKEHASKARDDFYMAVLAARWRCPVLTEDRFRDFASWRRHVTPFHVHTYSWFTDAPETDYMKPESDAYQRLRKPRTIRSAELVAKITASHDA